MDKQILALLMVCSLLAGCDGIPDPQNILGDEVITNEPDWETLTGEYVVIIGDNNSTAPVIEIGNNSTWLEIQSVNYTAVHLSFTVDNNTVLFHNYTFEIDGLLTQNGITWNTGYAPSLGKAQMVTSDYPYDITVNYTISYREWMGNE